MSPQPTTNPTAPAPSCSLKGGAGDSFSTGPWIYEPLPDYSTGYECKDAEASSFLISDAEGYYIATIICDVVPQHKANARLIAAAPCMFKALNTVVSILETDQLKEPNYTRQLALDLVRSTLEKAKGQQ